MRLALGARRGDVLRLVAAYGLKLFLLGTAIGLTTALALSRMGHLLFGVSPSYPLPYVSVTVPLAAVTLLACYLPARRAVLVEPMVALRCE